MFATSSAASINKAPIPFTTAPVKAESRRVEHSGDTLFGLRYHARDFLEPLAPAATNIQVHRDGDIIAQGGRAEYCFQIVTGCVRTVRLLEDGRRQVGEFLLPGDIFGWEMAGAHEFAAEAVTPATLRRFRLGAIEERADEDRVFAHHMRRYTAEQVRTARGRLVLLGRKTAAERIASFLLEMHERLRCSGAAAFELPMSRADMADYLGLTIETVSRGLTELRRRGTIAVERTRIAIHDGHALGAAGYDRLH
jgi:CRP/FNR family transcriptional regulator, nitrogen fixation regulation protein